MSKITKPLSALEVKRLASKPGFHSVGGVPGLHLKVRPPRLSWILRAPVGNKRPDIGLGVYPEISLAVARERAQDARELIRQGVDPMERKKALRRALSEQQARITFREAATAFLRQKTHEFRNRKHAAQWEATLKEYAYPVMGNLPVDEVERRHVMSVLEPIWTTKTETAKRLRGRIESVLEWAKAAGHRTGENPAQWRGSLKALLPSPTKIAKVKHHPAVPWQEIGAFMAELRQRDGMGARALELLILTATRSGEVRLATWSEIDLQGKLWTIPEERMKAGKEHRVPLTEPAVRLLEGLPRMQGCPYVFWAPRGGQLSDMSISAVTRRMDVDAVPHGFRSTFRDWAAEQTSYPNIVAEMALAHTIPDKVEAAYRRGDLMAKRVRMMRDWARFCAKVRQAADVVAIRGGR